MTTQPVIVVAVDRMTARDALHDVDDGAWRYVGTTREVSDLDGTHRFLIIDPTSIPTQRMQVVHALRARDHDEVNLLDLPPRETP